MERLAVPTIPPMPPWEGMHPLVVHFPIAAFMLAPLLVVLTLVWRSARRPLGVASLIVVIVGVAGAFLAVATGEAGEAFAEAVRGTRETLHEHEELAETTRLYFSVLAGVLAAGVGAMLMIEPKRLRHRYVVIAGVLYLIAHGFGLVFLADTAHQGGRLVHEFGVRAPMGEAPRAASPREDE